MVRKDINILGFYLFMVNRKKYFIFWEFSLRVGREVRQGQGRYGRGQKFLKIYWEFKKYFK